MIVVTPENNKLNPAHKTRYRVIVTNGVGEVVKVSRAAQSSVLFGVLFEYGEEEN